VALNEADGPIDHGCGEPEPNQRFFEQRAPEPLQHHRYMEPADISPRGVMGGFKEMGLVAMVARHSRRYKQQRHN
jgi:hypothetical protein